MTTNNAHRPEFYPPVPPDFDGPVLLEVYPHRRMVGYRFVRAQFDGTTDDLDRAWMGRATEATRIAAQYREPTVYPVSAEAVLADERARLDAFAAAIEAVKNGKGAP